MKFPRIYADEQGETHIGVLDLAAHEAPLGPPPNPLGRMTEIEAVTSFVTFSVPAGTQVPAHKAEPLYDYLGKQVVFGIRPEDVHDPEYAPPGIIGAPVKARVDVTELMGNEVFLYLVTGQTKSFIARVDPRTSARVGQEVEVLFNMENMHVFDRDTEIAIR